MFVLIRATLLENLRHIDHAPSVQFHTAPKPLYFPEEDEDMRDPDVRTTQEEIESRVQHDAEMSDSDEEDNRRDSTIPIAERPPIDPKPIPPILEEQKQSWNAPSKSPSSNTADIVDFTSVHSAISQSVYHNTPEQNNDSNSTLSNTSAPNTTQNNSAAATTTNSIQPTPQPVAESTVPQSPLSEPSTADNKSQANETEENNTSTESNVNSSSTSTVINPTSENSKTTDSPNNTNNPIQNTLPAAESTLNNAVEPAVVNKENITSESPSSVQTTDTSAVTNGIQSTEDPMDIDPPESVNQS